MKYSLSFIFLCLFTFSNYIVFVDYIPIGFIRRLPFVLISLATGFYALEVLAGKKRFLINAPSICLIIVLLFVTYTTFFDSVDPVRSKDLFSNFFLKSVILFFLISNIIDTRDELKAYFLVLTVCTLHLAYQYVHNAQWQWGRAFLTSKSIFAGDPNCVAMVLVYSLPFIGICFMIYKSKWMRLFLLYCIFYSANGIVVTESRGGFLSFLTMFTTFFISIPGKKKKMIMLAISMPVLAVFFLRYVPMDFYYRMQEISAPETDHTGSAELRLRAMTVAFDYLLRNPISEYGMGNHSYYLYSQYGGSDPENNRKSSSDTEDIFKGSFLAHNSYIQFGADNGLIPVLFFLTFIGSFYIYLIRIIKRTNWNSGKRQDQEILIFSKGLIISLSGYLMGAFFLPIAYRFYLYYICGLSMVVYKLWKDLDEENVTST